MAKGKNIITVRVNGQNITGTKRELDKLVASQNKANKANQNLGKSSVSADRGLKGTANMSSNVTKNFSKMQQGMDGGGGSGGLVRAYALLAANVFALTAAFGILSRGAQVDTLIQSMERLEVVSGKSIKTIARDLQRASGFGMDFAASLRSTSLALSAGFESKQIFELGEVARNAAVSLGRNVPDALDRIFRGVIKVEPELLDEIGLFVRVNEAAAKYASQLGIAVGDLTEFQKRQAFANEAIQQGQDKFQAFEDIQIDPFAQLATTFSDMTQGILTFVNKGLKPVIELFTNNKVLFGQLFLIVGMQLFKMVIPAIGQFTLGIATNAAAARTAAVESAAQAQAKIRQLQTEGMEYDKIKEKALSTRAQEKRLSSKPQKLAVGGRKASASLEKSLQDRELAGAQRLEVVQLRISDLRTKKGFKIRMQNADTKRELQLLKQERDILVEQVALKSKIDFVGPMPSQQADKGSLANLVDLKNQKDVLKADALATVTATTEFKGMGQGFKALGRQIEVTDHKAKAAGISFTRFDKVIMRMGGTAAIVGVKLQAMMMVITPFITALMIAIPVVTFLSKQFGFFGESQSELKTANKETAETFKTLTKQMKHNKEQFDRFADTDNFKGMTDSVLAMKESILGATTALTKQVEAFEKYQSETKPFVKNINESVSRFFGRSAEEKIQDNVNQLLDTIRDSESGISEEMKKLEAQFDRASIGEKIAEYLARIPGTGRISDSLIKYLGGDTSSEESAILELAKSEVEAYKNAKSAIDGARDSAREFSNSLIVKTQVDKPLASFKQITKALQNQVITEKERKVLMNETINDSAVLALLTEDQRNNIRAITDVQIVNGKEVKKIVGSSEELLSILDEVELTYARQQELLIKQKSELGQIKGLLSQIKTLRKFSVTAIDMEVKLTQRQRNLELEGFKNDFNRKTTQTGLTEERLRELSALDTLVGREQELGLTLEQISMVQTAIAAMKTLQTEESKEQMRLATLELKTENDKVKAALEFMKIERELNKVQASRLRGQAKLAAFSKRGSTKLNMTEELDVITQQEDLRNKNLQQRVEAEMAVAQFQFLLADRELEVIKQRQIVSNAENKRLNMEAGILLTKTNDPIKEAEIKDTLESTGIAYEAGKGIVKEIEDTQTSLGKAAKSTIEIITQTYAKETEDAAVKLVGLFEKNFGGSSMGTSMFAGLNDAASGGLSKMVEDLKALKDKDDKPLFSDEIIQTKIFEQTLLNFADTLKSTFGEQGILPAALGTAAANFLSLRTAYAETMDNVNKMPEGAEKTAAGLAANFTAIAGGIAQVSSVYSAYMKGNIQQVDDQISAEKARDGQSEASLAKITQLEKKKESLKKKEFETSKKLQLAQAVMNTAAGVTSALSSIITAPMAPFIAAMGAVQIALISKMKYTGGAKEVPAPQTSSLTIGKRGSAVDTAQQTSGGELNYLRGGNTDGTNLGGAGGAMGRKGYANGGEGIVVGERGPEIVSPSAPVDITPNFALGGGETNVNFTINAVDATGVEDLLINQRGNLIRMIREAANENGEEFLPTIDPMAYGSKT